MKDCFMGLHANGNWLTICSAIGSSTLNSSSSSSKLSLGLCWMVCSISVSIGRMVEFLDRSPCMKQMRFCTIATLVLLFEWFLELRLITQDVCSIAVRSIALGQCLITIIETTMPQNWNKTEKQKTKIFRFFIKIKMKITENGMKWKWK